MLLIASASISRTSRCTIRHCYVDDICDMSRGHVMCCGVMIWHKRKHLQDSEVLSKHSRRAISRVQMHIRVWTHQVRHKGLNGLYVGVD